MRPTVLQASLPPLPSTGGLAPSRFALRAGRIVATLLCLGLAFGLVRRATGGTASSSQVERSGGRSGETGYRGVLTFATPGNGDPFAPTVVQELDLATGELAVRLDGLDPSRNRRDEIAFVQRLGGGHFSDHGIVVVDQRGVPGPPLHVCKQFNWSSNRGCGVPKVSPDGRQVAFAIRAAGTYCKDYYGTLWGTQVIVTDRRGRQLAMFEGYDSPDWMPDGRLLMMGTQCREAGIWMTDGALGGLHRIDGEQVLTPAYGSAVSPDGRRLAFVWNNQLWALDLTGAPELTQLTRLPKSVTSAAWSPDGSALAVLQFDVSMPVRSVVLMRPGDQSSVQVLPVPAYPYGPISWR